MVTWTDVRAWRHGPLAEAGQSLRSLGTTVADLAQDAQQAGSRIASQAPSVDAARAALSRCGASHEELLAQVTSLTRATTEAGQGVAAVSRKVLAALDYANAHPMVTLHPDGTVSAAPATSADADPAAGEAAGASRAGMGAAAGLAGLTAEQIQEQAAELEQMVTAALTLADQVDAAYASTLTALTALAVPDPQPGPWPCQTRSPGPGRHHPTPTSLHQPVLSRGETLLFVTLAVAVCATVDSTTTGTPTTKATPTTRDQARTRSGARCACNSTRWVRRSGPHAQRSPTLEDYANHEAATLAADGFSPWWPDAAENLHHYLGNTGDPQSMDVDKMLEDLSDLSDDTNADVTRMAEKAVEKSQETGATGPVTYPFTTEWSQEYTDQSTQPNWFYATGNYKAATDGTITVYPPTDENPEWTYKYDYRVHTADRYHWDGTKSTKIVGVPITDKQLQELHQAGLAQEYDLVGESSPQHGEGPP